MHQRPHGPGQAAVGPGLDHDLRQGFRLEHVVGRQVRAALQKLHPQAQVVEFDARRLRHGRSQARGRDLALHQVVVDQAQGRHVGVARLAAHADERLAPLPAHRGHPILPLVLEQGRGLHRQLDVGHRTACAAALRQLAQVVLHQPHQLDDGCVQRVHELLAHLAGNSILEDSLGRCGHGAERNGMRRQYRMTNCPRPGRA